ncbi:MAG: tyrosine-type recombinase/integrase [Eubacteriales bacterium]|nr:tyrosine-type recombinase/integrase [Eubacteriales bacterium]
MTRPHTLRHTGCTRMAEAGIDPKVLQYIMGHSKIAVTMEVYNHVSTERNRTEMDKIEKMKLIV